MYDLWLGFSFNFVFEEFFYILVSLNDCYLPLSNKLTGLAFDERKFKLTCEEAIFCMTTEEQIIAAQYIKRPCV